MWPGIYGHEQAIAVLRRAMAMDRLHHAYLFAGPEGVGKKKVARALAQALNCLSSPGTPCGRCSSCVRIASQEHPDVVELVPDTSKARPTIKIEQVREVTRQVCFKPYEAR
jgi:DNA polymerase-3 subunit delta'